MSIDDGKLVLEIVNNDITKENTDAITNASFKLVDNVASANFKSSFVEETEEYIKNNGPIPTGGSEYAGAGEHSSNKYIIHTMGPVYEIEKRELCEI